MLVHFYNVYVGNLAPFRYGVLKFPELPGSKAIVFLEPNILDRCQVEVIFEVNYMFHLGTVCIIVSKASSTN